ncbi:hypothetical protein VP01_1946g4 [Puccinia sorghi]|uniref:Uncharacterized protein n=1 Tax=Puccinia sorghi TaxID=27349 RepID=A0A0L6VE33_9BASI|nr:hypothetical protein VP01_1946g4 [Puccinia sorghi]
MYSAHYYVIIKIARNLLDIADLLCTEGLQVRVLSGDEAALDGSSRGQLAGGADAFAEGEAGPVAPVEGGSRRGLSVGRRRRSRRLQKKRLIVVCLNKRPPLSFLFLIIVWGEGCRLRFNGRRLGGTYEGNEHRQLSDFSCAKCRKRCQADQDAVHLAVSSLFSLRSFNRVITLLVTMLTINCNGVAMVLSVESRGAATNSLVEYSLHVSSSSTATCATRDPRFDPHRRGPIPPPAACYLPSPHIMQLQHGFAALVLLLGTIQLASAAGSCPRCLRANPVRKVEVPHVPDGYSSCTAGRSCIHNTAAGTTPSFRMPFRLPPCLTGHPQQGHPQQGHPQQYNIFFVPQCHTHILSHSPLCQPQSPLNKILRIQLFQFYESKRELERYLGQLFDMQKVPGSFYLMNSHGEDCTVTVLKHLHMQTSWLEHTACQLQAVEQVFFFAVKGFHLKSLGYQPKKFGPGNSSLSTTTPHHTKQHTSH